MVTMFGWLRRPAERASRRKRSRTPSMTSSGRSGSSVLIATSRSINGSTARYTAPMAPRPSSLRILYRPRVCPRCCMARLPGGQLQDFLELVVDPDGVPGEVVHDIIEERRRDARLHPADVAHVEDIDHHGVS